MTACYVPDCERARRRQGLCVMHYGRFKRHGNPLTTVRVIHSGTAEERFWAKVQKTETCWLWLAAKDGWGYGSFEIEGRSRRVHRLSYEWAFGTIPDALPLDHLCRVRNCVNPAHLEAVTTRVNVLRGIGITAMNLIKDVCPMEHPYDEANTYWYRGHRSCKTCRVEATRRWRAARGQVVA